MAGCNVANTMVSCRHQSKVLPAMLAWSWHRKAPPLLPDHLLHRPQSLRRYLMMGGTEEVPGGSAEAGQDDGGDMEDSFEMQDALLSSFEGAIQMLWQRLLCIAKPAIPHHKSCTPTHLTSDCCTMGCRCGEVCCCACPGRWPPWTAAWVFSNWQRSSGQQRACPWHL